MHHVCFRHLQTIENSPPQESLTDTPKDPDYVVPEEKLDLSPISGSIELESGDKASSRSSMSEHLKHQSSTNELPLTELNLALFTSKLVNRSGSIMSTNELPLSEIKFDKSSLSRQNTLDSQGDNFSIEANWDADLSDMDELVKARKETRHRSFSDPNILNPIMNLPEKHFLLKKYNDSLIQSQCNATNLTPPTRDSYSPLTRYPDAYPQYRPLPALLSFFTSRSLSHPAPNLSSTPSYAEVVGGGTCGAGGGKQRHRHSIAGQMSYFKMLGFGCGGPMGLKKLVGGSTSSLFSTAVISGSSSAPNLRDMISNTSSATGKFYLFCKYVFVLLDNELFLTSNSN